jgi:hypothetical protein
LTAPGRLSNVMDLVSLALAAAAFMALFALIRGLDRV